MKFLLFAFLYFSAFNFCGLYAQKYTRQDSLRGSYHQNRSCYDLTHYHLKINVKPDSRYIAGFCKLSCIGLTQSRTLQIDLAENFDIEKIVTSKGAAKWKREGNSVLVTLPEYFLKNEKFWVQVHYGGHPQVAASAPWDGGFVWQKDKENLPWIGLACEGEGSSLWFPSKDHPADEPDSVFLQYEVPKNLTAVGNGIFIKKEAVSDSTALYSYKVTNPINHYNISFNAGFYSTWQDTMRLPESGKLLKMSFYALPEDLAKAKRQWAQTKTVVLELSKLFGDYPFAKDGYKMVQTPFLGMEHQSCIAYGDKFEDNAFGFDFIVMHETGHEWWGNQTSADDHADMWLHESFCTYAEALYVEKLQGKEKAVQYILTQKKRIKNKSPIQGPRGVYFNNWKDSDMYFKGTWMLHSLRQLVDNDKLWFEWLKSFAQKFGTKPISGEMVESYASSYFKLNLEPFFNQYLKQTEWPQLMVKMSAAGEKGILQYRWNCKEIEFHYPVEIVIDSKPVKIYPEAIWKTMDLPSSKSKCEPKEGGMLLDWKLEK